MSPYTPSRICITNNIPGRSLYYCNDAWLSSCFCHVIYIWSWCVHVIHNEVYKIPIWYKYYDDPSYTYLDLVAEWFQPHPCQLFVSVLATGSLLASMYAYIICAQSSWHLSSRQIITWLFQKSILRALYVMMSELDNSCCLIVNQGLCLYMY